MSVPFSCVKKQAISPFQKLFSQAHRFIPLGLLAVLSTSCSEAPPPLDFSLQVQPSGRPGVYRVVGQTNLPDQSRITVQGIRYLQPPAESQGLATADPNYAILARQTVEVSQGQWQATLNLWQVGATGDYQEVWQDTTVFPVLTSTPAVTFQAIAEPANQPKPLQLALEQKIQDQGRALAGEIVRFTETGEGYLHASQTLPVSLPTGKTEPPVLSAADINGGWGDRAVLKPEPAPANPAPLPTAQVKLSDLPLSAPEFLR